MKTTQALAINIRNRLHVAVNGHNVGKTTEGRRKRTITFAALTVHDVRLNFAEFFSRRTDAALIKRAHPANFGNDEAVKKDVGRDFFWRWNRFLQTGNDVNLYFRQRDKPLQQGFGSRAEIRLWMRVISVVFTVVGGEQRDFQAGSFWKTRLWPTWRISAK